MGMSEYILSLQSLPSYEEGYKKPGEACPYHEGDERAAFRLGQQDWEFDNRPRDEV